VVVTVLYAYCTSGYGGTRIDGGHNNRLVAVHVVQVQILHVPAAQDILVLVEGCIRIQDGIPPVLEAVLVCAERRRS
jgi:hypothetical protein